MAKLLADGKSSKTARNVRGDLAHICNHAMREDWLYANPVTGAERPNSADERSEDLRFADVESVHQLARDGVPKDDSGREVEDDLYLVGAMTGMRQGELLGLAYRQVDFSAGVIPVVRQASDRSAPDGGVLGLPRPHRLRDRAPDFGATHTILASEAPLHHGDVTVPDLDYDRGGVGRGGLGTLHVNDSQVARHRIDATVALGFSADEGVDVGMDNGTPAANSYEGRFPLTGTIDWVEITIPPDKP